MARNGTKRGAPGHAFALMMAVIFVLMVVMIFLTHNKKTASPNVTTPAKQHPLH